MAHWHDIESARDHWVDAPLDDELLTDLLAIARDQIVAYAPALPDDYEGDPDEVHEEDSGGDPLPIVPRSWRYYQLQQARNIWNASKVDPASGGIGDDTFVIRPHPLDWVIKQGLRPRKAVPRVG